MKKKGCEKRKKKKGADTEMGYCPFEHKAGCAGRALGAGRARSRRVVREAQARNTGDAGPRHGARHSAQGRAPGAATWQPGAVTRQARRP